MTSETKQGQEAINCYFFWTETSLFQGLKSLLAAHLRKKETGDIELGVHKDRLNWRLHRQSCHKQPRGLAEEDRQDEKREK